VINPAWGIPAAPIEAAVAVTLHVKAFKKGSFLKRKANSPHSDNVTQG
jgi:hypothetical protein